jgi:hypothetical protein
VCVCVFVCVCLCVSVRACWVCVCVSVVLWKCNAYGEAPDFCLNLGCLLMVQERRARAKSTAFKCDHCKLSVDELPCNLYQCIAHHDSAHHVGCFKHCCQACALHMDQSVAQANEVPNNADIVCSSCASADQKANWWIMNPTKGSKKRQKQRPGSTANNAAKVRGDCISSSDSRSRINELYRTCTGGADSYLCTPVRVRYSSRRPT